MAGAGTTSASDCHLNQLEISINMRLEGLSPPSDCCIFIVPWRLRRTNEEAYMPRVVAIGPYHRLNTSLKPMEDHKLWYLKKFLQDRQNYSLRTYIERVKSWVGEARNCYDQQIDLDSDEFSKMMLLDGIFVIQLLLMNWDSNKWLRNDRIFREPGMLIDVCRDMALLENQMPFFIVQRLFKMAFQTHQQPKLRLLELVCRFFSNIIMNESLELEMESEVKHFVHVISLSLQLSKRKAPDESHEKMKFTPNATELVAAGVKLNKDESKCLFNIEFKDGVLNIPYLVLEDSTEYYFRNIIAFEQCYCEDMSLTDYVAFMHHLVDTPADAELLINKGIIENLLSNKEAAARVISTFGKENVLLRDHYYNSLSHELIKYCEKPCNQWKATFKRDYCSNPWVVISVIAAVVLLLLSVVQTVCSILSVV